MSPNPKNPDFYTLPAEGKGNEKGKGDKEGTRQGQQGFECNRQRYWDHIGSKTKFSGTLVKVKLVILAVTASKNPIHDAKQKTSGSKGNKGAKSGKENDGKGKDKGDGKDFVFRK